ncbi:MAG: phosphotransferase family protein [Acidimicrobiia bacterium]
MTLGRVQKSQLEKKFSARRPEAEQVRVSAVTELSEGWETDVYRIAVHYLVAGTKRRENYVVRLYGGAFGDERAARESQVLKRSRQAGLPVPRVEFLVRSGAGLSVPFVVLEEVRGATLARALTEGSDREGWLEAMVRLLVSVHRVNPHRLMEGLSAPHGVIPPDLEAMNQAAEEYQLAGADSVLGWLERNAAPVDHTVCLLHSDFHPGNIMVRDSQLVALDWSFAEMGDHRLDLAWTALLLTDLLGVSYRAWLLDSYERLSGRSVSGIDYFEGLKLGARLMTVAAWLEGSLEIPVKKITPEAIRGDYRIHVVNVYKRWKQVTRAKIGLFEAI